MGWKRSLVTSPTWKIRSSINQLHPFVSVVVIAMMGVLAGVGRPDSIARRARFKKPFLERVLDLPHGVPGNDSIVGKRRGCGWNDDFMLEVLAGTAG
ncbi:transposase family protein [Zavarzinella formosa]|uniref:transposase family protein n=1 Tax=Zavarzinella formosa TaxID=360055 RepID=UPI000380C091|nr:transposase family protein [Zavarzinella formosa]